VLELGIFTFNFRSTPLKKKAWIFYCGSAALHKGVKLAKMKIHPAEIEAQSMAIITELLGKQTFPPLQAPIVKRIIHATADFDYAANTKFSPEAVAKGHAALLAGWNLVTDTQMAAAGINQKCLARFGGTVACFMSDAAVCREAKARGETRAAVSIAKAVRDPRNKIFVIGNAPTALIRLCELIRQSVVMPELVIGVPVGFVNVIEAKAMLAATAVPYILTAGRKGGSTVAAAIVNALLYQLAELTGLSR
jgi:precorrin-8X/cobalt-precorrin-8 methylmutase